MPRAVAVPIPIPPKSRRPKPSLRVIHDVKDLPVICDCADAGLLLRRTPETIARMAKSGELPGVKQGQSWYFRRDDLVAYLNDLFAGAAGHAEE